MDLLIFIIIFNLTYQSSCILYWPVPRTNWLITLTGYQIIYAGIDLIYIAQLYIADGVQVYGMFQFVGICFNEGLISSSNKKKATCDQIELTNVVQPLR
jgi:hypothetical protein